MSDGRFQLQWGFRFLGSEGGSSLIAEVSYREQVVCRLSLQARDMSPEEARAVLLTKAVAWIADYQKRDHAGDTAFGDIAV